MIGNPNPIATGAIGERVIVRVAPYELGGRQERSGAHTVMPSRVLTIAAGEGAA
jgi:hypothetical protein